MVTTCVHLNSLRSAAVPLETGLQVLPKHTASSKLCLSIQSDVEQKAKLDSKSIVI